MKDEGDGDTNCNVCTWNYPRRIGKGIEDIEIKGPGEAIQTTALLRSARILRRVLET